MPTPPVTNPTPFTCPNCGAGLTTRAEFCPHCGASLQHKAVRNVGWTFGSIGLGCGTLIFGGVGACSVLSTYESLTLSKDVVGNGFLIVSIPLLLIGLVGLFFCGRALWRRLRE